MITALLEGVLNFQATLVQVVLLIPNKILTELMPNLDTLVTEASNNFLRIFDGLNWALGLLPDSFITFLIGFLGIHLIVLEILGTVKLVSMVFKLFKNINPL